MRPARQLKRCPRSVERAQQPCGALPKALCYPFLIDPIRLPWHGGRIRCRISNGIFLVSMARLPECAGRKEIGNMENSEEYYKRHGPMTAPEANAAEFNALPRDIGELCQVVGAARSRVAESDRDAALGRLGIDDDERRGVGRGQKNCVRPRRALSLAGDDAFSEVRAIYESEDRLRVTPLVFNALRSATEPIAN